MTLPWTWHGGGLEAARRHFGGNEAAWIDLSTGINPVGWPGCASVEIDWARLPDPQALARLEAAAAAHFGTDPRHVCAVPGSEIGLRLVGRLIGGAGCHTVPSYRTHAEMFAATQAIDLSQAPRCVGPVIIANPNNPDGRTLAPHALAPLLERRGPTDWLLVDEAYADCVPAISVAPHIRDDARLLIFRSFGKFFGLAGVRLGFVLGPEPFLAALRALLGAWPLSAAAIAIGTAAYHDSGWTDATRERLRSAAVELDAMLQRHGFAPGGDCPLFRLVETPDAHALFESLARAAILTRPFSDQPRRLRIGLPPAAAALARLDSALANG